MRGDGLAALAEVVSHLPAEVRMGPEAAETYAGSAAAAGHAWAEAESLLPEARDFWASPVPVKVDTVLPPNVWTLVDGSGRGLAAGILDAPTGKVTAP